MHFFLLRAICSIKPDRSPRTCGLNLTRRGAETLAQLGLIETAPSDSSPGLVIFAAWFVCVSARGQAVRERARRLAQAGWLVRLVGDRRPFRAMSAHMDLRVSCQFQRLQPARGTREGEVVASQPHDAGSDSDSGRFFLSDLQVVEITGFLAYLLAPGPLELSKLQDSRDSFVREV